MNNAQRREYWAITPFSTERLSLGRPDIYARIEMTTGPTCQERILTGSPRVAIMLGSSVWGTPSSFRQRSISSAMAARQARYLACRAATPASTVASCSLAASRTPWVTAKSSWASLRACCAHI
ncbi:hypothetical protein EYF80_056229 [Liparis tanakae]|uniref:Uncharacterized protein n=1 Tax=Liparis tanakae TaxID=230148 RepID=A0A4Z2EYE8_9TELE|nr:hypothetical protein EYF80_056229 [Liparis tanakae]